MKTKFLLIGLLCLGLLSCEKDNKREKDVSNDKEQEENVEQEEVRGFLPGVFSVSYTTKVQFSQGNLQYQASTNTWRFAKNQWDYVGDESYGNVYENGVKSNNDENISKTYDGWIDLFEWGKNDYKKIYGGNLANDWFTLSFDEWNYLLNDRPNASSKKGVAMVNGVNGLVLLPDDWTLPSGVHFTSGFASNDGYEYYKTVNTYTASEWTLMEEAGVVFLPAAGQRYFDFNDNSFVDDCDEIGFYWTSDYYVADLSITESGPEVRDIDNVYASYGKSLRLCKIYEK